MRDKHLGTILETESDEVIKSSVDDLVPIPSESEGISDDTCDVPVCDNSPPLDVLNDHFEIFSDFNDDCTSREPHVHVPNELPTHHTLMMDLDFIPSDDYLGIDLEVSFPSETRNKIFDPVIETLIPFSFENEDIVFNPGILSSNLLSHRGLPEF
nr:hypothetical protein [Tanacetum cinerariifolium]